MPATFEAKIVDITTLSLDAIVNAANPLLLGGGGVDGAIHRAAGPALRTECESIPLDEQGERCPTGQARITRGYLLPARHVVHTVGPIWDDMTPGEADVLLSSCYRTCLQVAHARGIQTIAFPCISTGVYGFPGPRAAQIAVNTARQTCQSLPGIRSCLFACFSEADLWAYQLHLRATAGAS
jgi:O-acetyl-ADP-ribose deacetylase (regulator of RNase III)